MPYDRSAYIIRTPLEGVAFDFAANATDFISQYLFDMRPVDNALTEVPQFDTSKLRLVATKKATDAEADEIDENLFYKTINLEEYKLGSKINPRNARDAKGAGAILLSEARKTKIVTLGLLMQEEAQAATLATTAANYPTALQATLAAGDRWDDTGDIEAQNIVADKALRNSCGKEGNALAMDVDSYDRLRLSQNLRSRTQYTTPGPVPYDLIKQYMKVDNIFVGRARRDTALEGGTAAVGGFWGTFGIRFFYNPSVGLEDMGYGMKYVMGSPYWNRTIVDDKRTGAAGSMRKLMVGTEYKLDKGFIESATSDKFAAGYLFTTITA